MAEGARAEFGSGWLLDTSIYVKGGIIKHSEVVQQARKNLCLLKPHLHALHILVHTH